MFIVLYIDIRILNSCYYHIQLFIFYFEGFVFQSLKQENKNYLKVLKRYAKYKKKDFTLLQFLSHIKILNIYTLIIVDGPLIYLI